MSMKRTDLEKNLAKKLDGRMKSGLAPQRYGKGSAAAAKSAEPVMATAASAPKPVPVSCRLPADVVAQLRERAASVEGGMSAVLTEAAQLWLAQPPSPKPAA
jgi:hypothetical protein